MRRRAEVIEEGVLIALSAARLSLRNRILVDTIAADARFQPDDYVPVAQHVLQELAEESESAAAEMRQLRRAARGRRSRPRGTHDYRDRDVSNLRLRARQYTEVAKALRELAGSPDPLRRLIDDAREAAWSDVERNLQQRLTVPEPEPDDPLQRQARIRDLIYIDLPMLASEAQQRRQDADRDTPNTHKAR